MATLTPLTSPVPRPGARPGAVDRAWLWVAAACSLVAAVTHLWVVPEHLEEWWPAALFFVVLAVAQLALSGLLLLRPTTALLGSAVVGTLGLVAFYVLTRTVDLPLLPNHGAHAASDLPVAWGVGNGVPVYPGAGLEEVGRPDLLCLAAELVMVTALVAVLPPRARRWTTDLAMLLGGALLALRASGVLA
jgi:hypothetical protein